MFARKHKILLIGATGYNCSNTSHQLDCCAWPHIANAPNPRDFDMVVLNLLDLHPTSCEWEAFHTLFNPKAARDVLFNKGTIIIVGDPRFRIPYSSQHGATGQVPFLTWTGINFDWDDQTGDTMDVSQERNHQRYQEYFKRLKSWRYSLAGCNLLENRSKAHIYETVCIHSLVTNRYRHQIAFEVVLTTGHDVHSGSSFGGTRYSITASGKFVFLPPISGTTDDALKLVLRDMCGLNICSEEPAWIQPLSAPRQAPIDEQITLVSQEIDSLQVKLSNLYAKRTQSRQYLKLLYEREFVLEPIVWKILSELGANVEEPTENNKEDGWITVNLGGLILEGVLEIKSTKKDHFTEDGRKQVIDWIQRGISQRQKKYKGLFIGNSAVDKPYDQRPSPFPDSWIKAAELSEICAFTTTQLYEAYQKDCIGQLDRDLFWKAMFECNGICKFEGVL